MFKYGESLCAAVLDEDLDDYKDAPVLRTRKEHTCNKCFKSYVHAWHLKRHISFECGQEPKIQCPYCTVKMKQRGHVYRHIRRCHSGQNVYVIDLN